jgi:DNA-binding CsgD family transcriptional regulator
MGYLIEDFIEATNAAQSRDEAFLLYRKALERLGFDSAVYTFVTDHLAAGQRAGHGVQCNFPGDWMAHYQEKGYQAIDPVTWRVKRTRDPFPWQDLIQTGVLTEQQDRILHEAQEAGLHCGVGIPLYGPRGELAGIGIASSLKDAHPDRNTLCKLKLLGEQFHLVYCALAAQEAPNGKVVVPPPLTPREAEIMEWWAEGKAAEDIAMILGCTKSNVKWHIDHVYKKLDVNTRIQAVAKAIRLGYIFPENIKIL